MEPTALARYAALDPKAHLSYGESSVDDPDVVEIQENGFRSSNSKKRKRQKVVPVDIIDIDEDEELPGVLIFGQKVDAFNKGKAALSGYDKKWGSKEYFSQDIKKIDSSGTEFGFINATPPVPPMYLDSSGTDFGFINATPPIPPMYLAQGFGNTDNLINPYDVYNDIHNYVPCYDEIFGLQAQFNSMEFPATVPSIPLPDLPVKINAEPVAFGISTTPNLLNCSWYNEEKDEDEIWFQQPARCPKEIAAMSSSAVVGRSVSEREAVIESNEVLKKYKLFKRFDTVQDYSDHHYICQNSKTKQASLRWTRTIQHEWKILDKDLPESIFVRVYEERMDLLRAVIIGAAGTPYHDGLFFFDFHFPSEYPYVPPQVYYHSGGLRLNPNLYSCGKVCLSLLNTWHGTKEEKWTPRKSTVLQILLSIQALVLNAKPFFNEPGYEQLAGKRDGEMRAQDYNEKTYILSCKTMLYTLRRPPKNFEDLVVGHFQERAHAILVSCKAYMEGAQVGCLVVGGVQDLEEGDKSGSQNFKKEVVTIVEILVPALIQNGAKDCEQFLPKPAKPDNNRKRTGLALRLF